MQMTGDWYDTTSPLDTVGGGSQPVYVARGGAANFMYTTQTPVLWRE